MKILKKLGIKTIQISILGLMIYGGWLVYQKWESFKPILTKLEEKDPEKYEQMWEEAKSFHISEAKKLYRELNEMKLADVINLRYKKLLAKRNADKKFQEDSYEKELQIRIKERKLKLEENLSKIKELKNLHKKKPIQIRFNKWKEIEPWEKHLILREKCIKFLKKEVENRHNQKSGLKISKLSTQISLIGKELFEIESLCSNIVSSATSSKDIQDSILRLKESMSFFYFIQLLDETGIPRGIVFRFDEKLNGMTRDYTDF